MIDLGRWVNEEYRVPGNSVPLEQPEADTSTISSEDD